MSSILSRRSALVGALALTVGAEAAQAQSRGHGFEVVLSGHEEVPPLKIGVGGKVVFTWAPTDCLLIWSFFIHHMSSPVTGARLQVGARGQNGPVAFDFIPPGGAIVKPPYDIRGRGVLSPDAARHFVRRELYVNVLTEQNPNGELRGQVIMPPLPPGPGGRVPRVGCVS